MPKIQKSIRISESVYKDCELAARLTTRSTNGYLEYAAKEQVKKDRENGTIPTGD